MRSYFPLRQTVNWDLFKQPDQINTSARTRVRFERRDGRLERMARRLRLEKVGEIDSLPYTLRAVSPVYGLSSETFLYSTDKKTALATIFSSKYSDELNFDLEKYIFKDAEDIYQKSAIRADKRVIALVMKKQAVLVYMPELLNKAYPQEHPISFKFWKIHYYKEDRSTPIFHNNNLYVLSSNGDLNMIDSEKVKDEKSDQVEAYAQLVSKEVRVFTFLRGELICVLKNNTIKNFKTGANRDIGSAINYGNNDPWAPVEYFRDLLPFDPANVLILATSDERSKSTLHLLDPSTFSILDSAIYYGSSASFYSIIFSGVFQPINIRGKSVILLWVINNTSNTAAFLIGKHKIHEIKPGPLYIYPNAILSVLPIVNKCNAMVFLSNHPFAVQVKIKLT